MVRHLAAYAMVLTILFTFSLSMIQRQTYDDRQLRTFLETDDECNLPCWMGIHPRVTSEKDAITILEANSWVDDLDVYTGLSPYDTSLLTWSWNDQTPLYINQRIRGHVWTENDVVQGIRIATQVPYGDLWLMMNEPQNSITFLISYNPRRIQHTTFFMDGWLQSRANIPCPLQATAFWASPVDIVVSYSWSPQGQSYSQPVMNDCAPRRSQ